MGHAGKLTLLGFGEAAQAFSEAGGWAKRAAAFDIKTGNPKRRAAKLADYHAADVHGFDTLEGALGDATLVLSLVTADQALAAARDAAQYLKPGALYCDLNSVAPESKRDAAQSIEAAGASYVDAAILAPVNPARLAVPLIVSGAMASAAVEALTALGFKNVRAVGSDIGRASAIKMVRSIMVKGLEALTTEWILAAEAAGVRDEAVSSLNHSWPGIDWAAQANYNLERMMVHGIRRAAEMEEVLKMLKSLGTGGAMTTGTVRWQKSVGRRGLTQGSGKHHDH